MQMTLKCLRVLYLLNHIPCWSLLSLCKTKNKKQKNHFLIRNVLLWAGRSTMGTVSQACGSQSEAWGMKRQQGWGWTLEQMPWGWGVELARGSVIYHKVSCRKPLTWPVDGSTRHLCLIRLYPLPQSRKTLFHYLCSIEKLGKRSAHSFSWILI